ncbi:SUMF1/EgtB/PvdO family nonheme iron enzyme [Terricaulis sp.]|uniref:SUMF1/EgtB/PvdO family nonheme iron enzyme n=1 Tax=Terricaulis sp. TaxID=2768686 RepID=UPI00378339E5
MGREAIFIGYRRDDTADVAGRIYDALERKFGRDRLFKDVDNLRPGADFGAYIKSVLPRCQVALILIGPGWLDARDEAGARRLDDPNDWVRVEVETALATPGLDVVPVLVNGARMPKSDELPATLHPLLRRHAAVIRRDPDFRDDVGKLSAALSASVKTGLLDLSSIGGERRAATAPSSSPPRRNAVMMFVGGVAVALVLVALGGAWRFLGPPESSPVETATTASNLPGEDADGPRGAATPTTTATGQSQQQGPQTPSVQTAPETQAPIALPDMVRIPGGSFVIGSPTTEAGRENVEGPQRTMQVAAFYLSRTEVTFAQWATCVDDGGCNRYRPADQGWGRGARPVINVSWNDAQAYVQWLRRRTGQRYRLPSEAEWEYAARAGTTTAYSTGASLSTSQARFSSNSTAPVGSFPANQFGLYDMHGNVWEWVEDCYRERYDATSCLAGISARDLRGGAWGDPPVRLRSASRSALSETARTRDLGFRVARSE